MIVIPSEMTQSSDVLLGGLLQLFGSRNGGVIPTR